MYSYPVRLNHIPIDKGFQSLVKAVGTNHGMMRPTCPIMLPRVSVMLMGIILRSSDRHKVEYVEEKEIESEPECKVWQT